MSKPAANGTQTDETTDETTTITTDGVTLEKTTRRKDEETLQVEFTISTAHDHPVNLVVVEPIPASVTLDEIGFHSDYWNNWFVDDDHLEHRVDLEPGTEHFTLYGVQADADTDPEPFLTEPTVEVSHESGTAPPTGQDPDAAAPQRAPESGVEVEPRQAAPETTPAGAGTSEKSSKRTDEPAEPTDSSVLAALAAEIETAEHNDESLDVLRDALDTRRTEEPTSVQARLERVEGEMNELAAYTDALEEFLDENGDGQSVLQTIETKHDRFDARLDTVAERLDTIEGRLATVDEHETTLESLRTDLDAVTSRLGALESDHEDTEERTRSNEQAMEGVSRSVSDLQDHIERVESTVATQTGDLQAALQELEDTVVRIQRWQQRFVDLVDVLSAPPALDGDDVDAGDVPNAVGGENERQ